MGDQSLRYFASRPASMEPLVCHHGSFSSLIAFHVFLCIKKQKLTKRKEQEGHDAQTASKEVDRTSSIFFFSKQ
jgi:hypothetical protein